MNDVCLEVSSTEQMNRICAKIDGPVHPVLREYDFDAVHGLTGKIFSGRLEPVTRIFRAVSEKPVFNEFRDGLFHFAQFVSLGVRIRQGWYGTGRIKRNTTSVILIPLPLPYGALLSLRKFPLTPPFSRVE